MSFNARKFLTNLDNDIEHHEEHIIPDELKEMVTEVKVAEQRVSSLPEPDSLLGTCPYCNKQQLIAGEFRSFNRKANRKCLWCGLISNGK